MKKFKKEIDTVSGFLFIAAIFYIFYFSMWIFY